jgi:SH3 domain
MNTTIPLFALYQFQGDPAQSQLSFPAGAHIEAIPDDQQVSWWFGTYQNQRGWFPPSYCRSREQSDELSPLPGTVETTTTTSKKHWVEPTAILSGGEPSELTESSSSGWDLADGGRDQHHYPSPSLFSDVMGGDTSHIHAVARNFGTSPVFNPAMEDYANSLRNTTTTTNNKSMKQVVDEDRDDHHDHGPTVVPVPTGKARRRIVLPDVGAVGKKTLQYCQVWKTKDQKDPHVPVVRVISVDSESPRQQNQYTDGHHQKGQQQRLGWIRRQGLTGKTDWRHRDEQTTVL